MNCFGVFVCMMLLEPVGLDSRNVAHTYGPRAVLSLEFSLFLNLKIPCHLRSCKTTTLVLTSRCRFNYWSIA